jgi:predicted aspartyl protease
VPSVSIEFPLLKKVTAFGVIEDALIPATLQTRRGTLRLQFILDTGADFSMLPRHMADVVGVDLMQAPSGRSLGIEGGRGIQTWLGRIMVTLGPYPLRLRCLFSANERTPYLLGRADLFSAFVITFDTRAGTIRLTPRQAR